MYNHTQLQNLFKHLHWDVAPGEETHKRMHPNDIRYIFLQKRRAQKCTHTLTHTIALGCGARKKEAQIPMHRNDKINIILLKEGHSNLHTHTRTILKLALGCDTSLSEKHANAHEIRWIILQKEGHNNAHTHTHKHSLWDVIPVKEKN